MRLVERTALTTLVTLLASLVIAVAAASEQGSVAVRSGNLNGSEAALERAKKMLEDPLGGVVVNRTVTVLGHDFYRYFAAWWRQTDEDNRYSISIHERPSARWGSEVWVQFRRDRVFHTFLPPARSKTKEISQMAVEIAYENITQNELQRAVFNSEDLGPEEM